MIGYRAFKDCSSLTSITIPNSVTSIGDDAFLGCSGLTEVRSMIEEPFTIDNSVFLNIPTDATLYVPAGTKSIYEATDGWKNFTNIVEMDLEESNHDSNVSYGGEDSEITEDTNLDGNIVGNIYYSISPGDGSYNSAEGCIELTRPTSDEQMTEVEGQDLFGEDLRDNFTGIIIKVPAGYGVLTVTAQSLGGMTLKVKVGNSVSMNMRMTGEMEAQIQYHVTVPTYIYIYGALSASARALNASGESPCLKIYGLDLKVTPETTDVSDALLNDNGEMTNGKLREVYDLQGRKWSNGQMPKGLNVVRTSDGQVRKVVNNK